MEVAPRIAHNLIVSTAAPVVVYFCQESVLFSIEIAKFWHILALFSHPGYFVANLRTFWCSFTELVANMSTYIAIWRGK